MEDVVILYRPTGPKELALVAASRWKRWPPRRPEQPSFYPVTNEAYARLAGSSGGPWRPG